MNENDTRVLQDDHAAAGGTGGRNDGAGVVDMAATLWRRRRMVLAVTLAAALATVAISLLLRNKYTASATIFSVSGANSTASFVSQYAGLAALAGVNLPNVISSSAAKTEAILKSRSLQERVISELDLVPVLTAKRGNLKGLTPEGAALEEFRRIFSVSVDPKTIIMRVSVLTESPTLSRDIANKAVDVLQEILTERVMSTSGKSIILLETQVADQEAKVREIQSRMTAFQKKTKVLEPKAQSQQGLQVFQALVQQRIALEIEISRLGSALSADNPKIVAARAQLDAIKKQISDFEKTGGGVGPSMADAPAALIDYGNLAGELELAMKIYAGLVASLENMRLQDAQEKVFVEVIDPAVAPEKKSEPTRSLICVVGTLTGLFFGILLAFLLDALARMSADAAIRAKFARGGRP